MNQFLVISYDISNDKRRTKAMKTLQDYGTRVQYSVFECRLKIAELDKLRKRLKLFVKDPQDSIRFYYINAGDVSRIEVIGAGKVTGEKAYYIQ